LRRPGHELWYSATLTSADNSAADMSSCSSCAPCEMSGGEKDVVASEEEEEEEEEESGPGLGEEARARHSM